MPSSATSATAFYAATKQAQQNSQKFSNYQLQNLSKQKNLMIQKSGSSSYASAQNASQPVDLGRVNNPLALHQIVGGQGQHNPTAKDGKKSSSVNAEKGNKNSFYLKQQLQPNNRTKPGSKDRSSLMKN